jgi:hypothetical protein
MSTSKTLPLPVRDKVAARPLAKVVTPAPVHARSDCHQFGIVLRVFHLKVSDDALA